jgi:hypothetical protein
MGRGKRDTDVVLSRRLVRLVEVDGVLLMVPSFGWVVSRVRVHRFMCVGVSICKLRRAYRVHPATECAHLLTAFMVE